MSEMEETIELRDEMEVAMGALQAVVNKLNQLINGEITESEYREWVEDNEEMFDALEF